MFAVEAFLVFAVAALDLTVVTRRVRANELVADAQLSSRFLKKRGQIALAIGKTVGELKAVVCLDAFYLYAFAGKSSDDLAQEVGRGIG